jgi:hypothetical protein
MVLTVWPLAKAETSAQPLTGAVRVLLTADLALEATGPPPTTR